MHASDYYACINIEELCAHNLELFEALAALNSEKAYQLQQADTQNSPIFSKNSRSQTQQSTPNIPEQPVFTWETPQEEHDRTIQDNPLDLSHSPSSNSIQNSRSTKSSSTKKKRGNNKKDKNKKHTKLCWKRKNCQGYKQDCWIYPKRRAYKSFSIMTTH